jgi:hypothetical protein
MYKCGFVANEYIIDAIYQSNMKRHNSAKRNYQRMVYETVENDKELQFGEMLDSEIAKLREVI